MGTVSAPRVRVGLIESMERQKRAFVVVAYEIPSAARFDGLLGLDFLRPGRLEIDFDRGLIGLQ